MHRIITAIATVAGLLGCAAAVARAEMGPCRADQSAGLVCGSGPGAARVIDKTLSPDKRLALAWRTERGDPTGEPDGDIALVLLRLSDGAILAKTATEYWDTGERHVNRLMEEASWSPDGRLLARAFQQRFDTGKFDLFALGAKDELIGSLDLQKVVEPAVRKRLSRDGRKADDYVVSIQGGEKISIANDGRMRLSVMMWVPKEGPEVPYEVVLRISRDKRTLGARITSIRPGSAR